MEYKQKETATKALLNKYGISIGLLIALVFLNQLLAQYAMGLQQEDTKLINVAGKQRMYSQKIVKASLGILHAPSEQEKSQYRLELWASLQQWEQNHRILQSEYGEIKSIFNSDSNLTSLYQKIQPPFEEMARAGRHFLLLLDDPVSQPQDLEEQLKILQAQEPLFLQGMEQIVNQYEEETQTIILRTEQLEKWIMGASIVIILIVSFFVFGGALRELDENIRKMREGRDNLAKLFLTAPNPMVLIRKKDNQVLMFNRQAGELFGIEEDQEASLNLNQMYLSGNPDDSLVDCLFSGNSMDAVEVILYQGLEQRYLHLSSEPIWYQGERSLIIGLSDITQLKEAEEILKRHATTDHMTGLLNKHYGLLALEEKLGAARKKGSDLSVCFMDVDYLKLVNDRYGHEEGDAYLRMMAEILLRSTGVRDVVFRYGGDEMVMILEDCGRYNGEKILARIERSMKRLGEKAEKPYPIHASFGLAVLQESPEATGEELLTLADKAMYENKKRYKESLGEKAPELR